MNKKLSIVLPLCLLGCLATAVGQEERVYQNGKWVRQAPPAEGTPGGELSLIRRDLDRKEYTTAVKHAEGFLKRYPGDPLREDVLGLAGDAQLRRGYYWQAYEWYEKQLAEFPNGANYERALNREIEIGAAFLSGKKRVAAGVFLLPAEDEGVDILRRIAEHAPGSTIAEIALLSIGDYYYNKRKWSDAVSAYDDFVKLFPKSERAAHAELRLADSLRLSYRGPEFDDTPLIEAEQRYRAFAQHYPPAAEEAGVEQTLKGIRSARAQKQFNVGQFYLRTGKRDAGVYYFRLVARQFGDTDWGERAEAELVRLGESNAPTTAPATMPARVEDKAS